MNASESPYEVFKDYDGAARDVLTQAQKESEANGCTYIVPCSLLLGIYKTTQLLDPLWDGKHSPDTFKTGTEVLIGSQESIVGDGMTVKAIVIGAADFARTEGRMHVNPRDVLRSILRVWPSTVQQAFGNVALSRTDVEERLAK